MYIGIAGNIGSGKSAMAKLLADEFGFNIFNEKGEENPYLADFYADMPRWALNLQVSFLIKRFKSTQRAMWSDEVVVQDRTIYEDVYVFVENLRAMHIMTERDYNTYRSLFDVMESFLAQPRLLIYLRASVPMLMTHIQQRGVAYESAISRDYLTMLNNRYESWFDSYRSDSLLIDIDNTDFVGNKADRDKVIDAIASQLQLPSPKKTF